MQRTDNYIPRSQACTPDISKQACMGQYILINGKRLQVWQASNDEFELFVRRYLQKYCGGVSTAYHRMLVELRAGIEEWDDMAKWWACLELMKLKKPGLVLFR